MTANGMEHLKRIEADLTAAEWECYQQKKEIKKLKAKVTRLENMIDEWEIDTKTPSNVR